VTITLVTTSEVHAKRRSMRRGYRALMAWTPDRRRARGADIQLGWEMLGATVRRRRTRLGWSQRDLSGASGYPQSGISRFENGLLAGMRMDRFALIVVALNGLELDAPAPPALPWKRYWD
jgi:hypothetical protein